MPGPPPTPARRGGVPLVLLGIGSAQFGAAFAGTVFDTAGPAGTALLRVAFAAVFLVAYARPSIRSHEPRHLRLAVLFGLLLGLMNLCIYESFARIGLGIAVTIEFSGPLAIAVALSRRRSDLACAAMAAVGIVLLADPGGDFDAVGVLLALAAGTCWAAYILVTQAAGRVFEGSEGLALAMCVAVLVPLVPGIAGGGSDLLSLHVLGVGAGVALLSSVLPYALDTEALRRLDAHVFGVLMSLEPAVAAAAGVIVLGEHLRARDVVAIALVVAASVVVTRQAASSHSRIDV